MFNVTLQRSMRQNWDENPSKSNQLSHVQPYVIPARVPFVIGFDWIERSSQNEGNCQCIGLYYIQLFIGIRYKF